MSVLILAAVVMLILGAILWSQKINYVDGKPYGPDGQEKRFDTKKIGKILVAIGVTIIAIFGTMLGYAMYKGKNILKQFSSRSGSPMPSHLRYYYF